MSINTQLLGSNATALTVVATGNTGTAGTIGIWHPLSNSMLDPFNATTGNWTIECSSNPVPTVVGRANYLVQTGVSVRAVGTFGENTYAYQRDGCSGNWVLTNVSIVNPYYASGIGGQRQLTPMERMREIIRARQAPMHLPSHRKLLQPTADEREVRARQTFRRIVGEHNWRSYCARGYVSVQAPSGLVYQIFAGHGITRVYRKGEMIERLCVVLSGQYPDSDSILMRYVMILSDEQAFRDLAVRHAVEPRYLRTPTNAATESLVDHWCRLKRVA